MALKINGVLSRQRQRSCGTSTVDLVRCIVPGTTEGAMNWPQFVYQYGIGGVFFLVTLLACLRLGAVEMRVPSDRRTVWISVVGFFAYLGVHAAWILLASG